MIALSVVYAFLAWLAFADGVLRASRPGDLAAAALEAVLWPLVLALATAGVAFDAVRAR